MFVVAGHDGTIEFGLETCAGGFFVVRISVAFCLGCVGASGRFGDMNDVGNEIGRVAEGAVGEEVGKCGFAGAWVAGEDEGRHDGGCDLL